MNIEQATTSSYQKMKRIIPDSRS